MGNPPCILESVGLFHTPPIIIICIIANSTENYNSYLGKIKFSFIALLKMDMVVPTQGSGEAALPSPGEKVAERSEVGCGIRAEMLLF